METLNAINEFERIERLYDSLKVTSYIREQYIWLYIVNEINNYEHPCKEQEFWCDVMDLFKRKYRQNESN